eukprot:1963044-Rhodomonas_salina.1
MLVGVCPPNREVTTRVPYLNASMHPVRLLILRLEVKLRMEPPIDLHDLEPFVHQVEAKVDVLPRRLGRVERPALARVPRIEEHEGIDGVRLVEGFCQRHPPRPAAVHPDKADAGRVAHELRQRLRRDWS